MSRATGSLVVLLVTFGMGSAAALAQPYPPVEASVTCQATSVAMGDSVACEAAGFAPASDVEVDVVGPTGRTAFSDTVQANDGGAASVRITIDAAAEAGSHEVSFTGVDDQGDEVMGTHLIEVTVGPAGASDGLSLLTILIVAGVVIVAGAATALYVRRQRSTRAGT